MENRSRTTLAHVEQGSGAIAAYDRARRAIAEALSIQELQQVRLGIEQMRAYARLAKDRDLMADVMALQQRSERRLGEMLAIAKERGQFSKGGRPKKADDDAAETGSATEQVLDSLTLKLAGIDRKLSARSQKLWAIPAQAFEEVVERAREKIRAGGAVVVNPVKDHTTKEKALLRAVREAQLAARQKALPERRYGVILADPEWPFATYSAAGMDRSADNHYPTSALEVIAARPVGTIATADCICALWVTMPHLAIGSHVAVLEGWGFVPKAVFIWDKVVAGTGYWGRNRVEALVIGVRGNVPAPAPGTQWEDLVVEAKTAHSAKPVWAHEWLEQYFPNLPKIELNARSRRDGWDAWGFEAPEDDFDVQRVAAGLPPEEIFEFQPDEPVDQADREPLRDRPVPSSASLAERLQGEQSPGQPASHSGPAPLAAPESSTPSGRRGGDEDGHSDSAAPAPGVAATAEAAGHAASAGSSRLSVEQQNDILRAGYAQEPKASIAELMAATGLKKSTVKMRLIRLGLSNPANQKAAARELMQAINTRRTKGAAGDSEAVGRRAALPAADRPERGAGP